jgi:sugar lactone lactonase YvrE
MNTRSTLSRLPRSGAPLLAGLLLASLFLTGCAAPKAPHTYVYFPPPPDEPRIQFLTSFSSEAGLGQPGTFTDFVVGREKYHRPIVKPYGITTTPGKIYIAVTMTSAIEVVDLNKRQLRYFKPIGEATLGVPINIAVDLDGTRYITDTKRNQVLVFKEETYAGAIGAKDEMRPTGVALFGDRLYVTDLKNQCVRVYNKVTRDLLFSVPRNPADEKAQLFGPTNVDVDGDGRIYVSDTRGFFVNVYDAQGNFLHTSEKVKDALKLNAE